MLVFTRTIKVCLNEVNAFSRERRKISGGTGGREMIPPPFLLGTVPPAWVLGNKNGLQLLEKNNPQKMNLNVCKL